MEQEKGKTFIVYITGASGNIACNFLPLLANGLVFGPDVKLELRLFDIEPALDGLKGVMYELEDCCYELVQSIKIGSNAEELMKDADVAIFIGGVPQGKDHKGRASLLVKNGPIFRDQGRILNKVANKNVKCVVVANPTNTNCLILKENAPDIPPQNFTCMTRLDYNRVVNNVHPPIPYHVLLPYCWLALQEARTREGRDTQGSSLGEPFADVLSRLVIRRVQGQEAHRRNTTTFHRYNHVYLAHHRQAISGKGDARAGPTPQLPHL